MPVCVAALNPDFSVFTSYEPGTSAGMLYSHSSLVVALRTPLVAMLRTVMLAPAIAAPVESFTSPVTVPSVCA
jgi:hypothetical protein